MSSSDPTGPSQGHPQPAKPGEQPQNLLRVLMEKAPGYAPEAFRFIQEGLAHASRMVHGEGSPGAPGAEENRHVSGRQLCLGLRDYAVRQYGLLARPVLNRWGVRKTEDFGRLVFAMIDAGLLRKTDDDSIEDFNNVFDFDEAFESLPPARVG